jgi:glycosyltransferase involved in cell wall biosynthesis
MGTKELESLASHHTPSVAVVVPAYNAEQTLERTLLSVLNQTMSDFELVVTDDGSTDSTYKIALALAQRDARLKVVRQANQCVAAARNSGVRNSRAPLIAAIDSDDVWHPTFLEKLAARLGEDGHEIVMAYANSRIIDIEDRVIWNAPGYRYSGWVLNQLLIGNFIGNGSAMMFRRDLATALGPYETRLQHQYGAAGCEDWLLALRLAARSKVAAVQEYLVGYRAVPGAMSEDTLRDRRSRRYALEVLFEEIDRRKCKTASWALGIAHAKCFLHEFRDYKWKAACKDLIAAMRLDCVGSCQLLFGSERLDWLLERVPWHEQSEQDFGSFWELTTTEGQWEAATARMERARRWDAELGRMATRQNSEQANT